MLLFKLLCSLFRAVRMWGYCITTPDKSKDTKGENWNGDVFH
uniref:Uncharacterized protein n=1 Tax=Rhizophora mucronata TaxID=61149 RepID=A0A2P2QV44_RHIMU